LDQISTNNGSVANGILWIWVKGNYLHTAGDLMAEGIFARSAG
jgi:hypothetical protein